MPRNLGTEVGIARLTVRPQIHNLSSQFGQLAAICPILSLCLITGCRAPNSGQQAEAGDSAASAEGDGTAGGAGEGEGGGVGEGPSWESGADEGAAEDGGDAGGEADAESGDPARFDLGAFPDLPGDEDSGDSGGTGEIPRFDLGGVPDFDHPGEDAICKIDFLFVIDNSTSMHDNQVNLTNSVPEFIRVLRSVVDLEGIHVGVITSDEYDDNGPACRGEFGALITRTGDGAWLPVQDCVPYASGLNFMTEDDDLETKFTCAAIPGSTGSPWELPMNGMLHAIRPELGGPGRCNEGFMRDDAMLVVTIITDEDEDPTAPWWMKPIGTPKEWYDEVVALKGSPDKVVMLGLLSIPPPNQCRRQDGNSRQIIEFIEMFGDNGHIGDVCAESYGEFFADAVGVIDRACDDFPEGR